MAVVSKSPINKDVVIIHSTYEDNPFLPKSYVEYLQNLIDQDENYYKIYALGEWGLLKHRIYENYSVIPELPKMEETANTKWGYGLDFGLNNESVLIKVYLYQQKFYVEEVFYRSGMTNSDIIHELSHVAPAEIWADPSSKQMIEEIRRAGYRIHEGHRNVLDGIDLCKRQTIYIPQSSTNVIKEIRSYKWKTDKDDHPIAEPVKYRDHAMDAMRYAIFGLTERYGFATAAPIDSHVIESLTFNDKGYGINDKIIKRWMNKNG